ncbi:MAG: flagellar biosynthesis repressor FlbT [Alphaproteobacteria bacterium]|nr:flagellar biosynthesis repressor FlbT [Alphaproteobacteria bacterium]MCL2504640.1 flagellar biosynthesis repressor FlbT [Alphaproteobacteria bacterium]
MPLKLRVKPEGKIFIGGAVLKNVGKRAADLLVISDGPVLRQNYMMNSDKSGESDFSNVYFLLQVIYLFRGKDMPIDSFVVETIKNFLKLYPDYTAEVEQILASLEEFDTFRALKIAHEMLAKYEQSDKLAKADIDSN